MRFGTQNWSDSAWVTHVKEPALLPSLAKYRPSYIFLVLLLLSFFPKGEQFSMRVNAFLLRNDNTTLELHFFLWFTTPTKCQRHNSSVLAINSLHVIFSLKCSLPAERTAVCHFHVGALWKIDKYMTAKCYNCDFDIMSFFHIGEKIREAVIFTEWCFLLFEMIYYAIVL